LLATFRIVSLHQQGAHLYDNLFQILHFHWLTEPEKSNDNKWCAYKSQTASPIRAPGACNKRAEALTPSLLNKQHHNKINGAVCCRADGREVEFELGREGVTKLDRTLERG